MNNPITPLHEFVFSNRNLLIDRCMDKVALRPIAPNIRKIVDHGVPIFLEQLVVELREEASHPTNAAEANKKDTPEISRVAGIHGAEMLRQGYNIEQVVHDYGDVCQSITELALEREIPIKTEEFRILNRSLDNAIAGAVTAFTQGTQVSIDKKADTFSERLNAVSEHLRRLAVIAARSHDALRTGQVGLSGATGRLLAHALEELRELGEKNLPDLCKESASASRTDQ